jgi:hypothetical protein
MLTLFRVHKYIHMGFATFSVSSLLSDVCQIGRRKLTAFKQTSFLYITIRDERKLSNKTDTSIQDSPTEQGRKSYMCPARAISSRETSSARSGGYGDFLIYFFIVGILYPSLTSIFIYYRQTPIVSRFNTV